MYNVCVPSPICKLLVMFYIQFIWNFPNTKNLLVAKIKLHGNILAPKVRPGLQGLVTATTAHGYGEIADLFV